jgi:hypothetical protein
MYRSTFAALALCLTLILASCSTQDFSGPQDRSTDDLIQVPALPTSNADLNCRYQPSGLVELHVGESMNFSPSAGNCDGAYATLSPGDGRVGFDATAPCVTFAATEGGSFQLFKVRRCALGVATMRIYTNSSGTTLLQTITIAHN